MTQGMGGQGSRRMQLLDDLRDMTRYWNLKERAVFCTFWKTRFGMGYGLIARQRDYDDDYDYNDKLERRHHEVLE